MVHICAFWKISLASPTNWKKKRIKKISVRLIVSGIGPTRILLVVGTIQTHDEHEHNQVPSKTRFYPMYQFTFFFH